MNLLCPTNWIYYELIDSSNFEKLERLVQYISIRLESKAVWDRKAFYKELGVDYLDSKRKKNQVQSYLDKLKKLGIEVEIKKAA